MNGSTVATSGDLRARILLDPDLILGDPAVMRALVARGAGRGRDGCEDGKVVDLRTVAVARLEARLGRLEAAHRTVIAAAYENLAGTQQVHRAILRLLDARSLRGFVDGLSGEVAAILRLDAVRLVVEDAAPGGGEAAAPTPLRPPAAGPEAAAGPSGVAAAAGPSGVAAAAGPSGVAAVAANDAGPPSVLGTAMGAAAGAGLRVVPPGWIAGRVAAPGAGSARVILRRGAVLLAEGGGAGGVPMGSIGSEAWLVLDLGGARGRGLVVLGSGDPDQFAPGQGTELLEFLAGVLERALRGWLA